MKRREVPKKVKLIPRAPLVLIWDTIRVVTVELSTSAWEEAELTGAQLQPEGPGRAQELWAQRGVGAGGPPT